MTLRIGVIGAGAMGSAHCRTIARDLSGGELAAVSDVDTARAARVAGALGDAQVHEDPDELIADPAVDAVVVASSDATHQAFVLACLRAEKPVLCEKPLAPTVEASLSVVEAEAAIGRRLVQVAFMRRFDPGYVAVKDRLDRGDVGAALLVHCAHRNASVPHGFTSEMLITSSVTHEIDVTRWLLGEEIVAATVHTPRPSRLAPAGVRDPQLVLLETEDGALVDVEIFVNARYGYDIRCEVVGESGALALAPPVAVQVRREGQDGHDVDDDFRGRFAAAYREQLQAWVHALADGGPDGPSAWDGYAAAAVADACLQSLAAGGRAEVRLAPRPALYADGGRVAVTR
ncbi:MAG: myo-inositol 2-dehydrogenase / D-chiro-inositol 1-dehydrogenase [Solirubrobacteraceae bacterium]|jgi:myo-inositol 2-dehydrogenase/D-chiro-inositol 1-dehydrogenase|nr:myo-inositol 2-dehydrogenase / D-chiro-inositol 1-dehydrogenase [Solirubrobacteraceae bacterium]